MDTSDILKFKNFLIMNIFINIIKSDLESKYNAKIFIEMKNKQVVLIITPNNTNYKINATYKLENNTIYFNLSTKETQDNDKVYEFSSYYQFTNNVVNHIYKMTDLKPLFPQLKDLDSKPTTIRKNNINLDSITPIKNPYLLLNKLLEDNYIRNDSNSIIRINSLLSIEWIQMSIKLLTDKALLDTAIQIDETIIESFKSEETKKKKDKELRKYADQNNRFIERIKRGIIPAHTIESVPFKINSKELYETNNWFTNINANRYAKFYNGFDLTKSSAIIKNTEYVDTIINQTTQQREHIRKNQYTISEFIDPIETKLLYPFCITDLFLYRDSRDNTMGYKKYNIASPDNIIRAFELIELSKQVMMTIMSLFLYMETELTKSTTNSLTLKININLNKIYSKLSWYNNNQNDMIFSFKLKADKKKKQLNIERVEFDKGYLDLPLIPLIEIPYMGVALPLINEYNIRGIEKEEVRLIKKQIVNYRKPTSLSNIDFAQLEGLEKLILLNNLTTLQIERLYKTFNYGIELENIEQELRVDMEIPDMESLEIFPSMFTPVEAKSSVVNRIPAERPINELKEMIESLVIDIKNTWNPTSQKMIEDLLYDTNIIEVNNVLLYIHDLIKPIDFKNTNISKLTEIGNIISKGCLYFANIRLISNNRTTRAYSPLESKEGRDVFRIAITTIVKIFYQISKDIKKHINESQLTVASSYASASIVGSNEQILLLYINILRIIYTVMEFVYEPNNENREQLVKNLQLFNIESSDKSIITNLSKFEANDRFIVLLSQAEQKRIEEREQRKQIELAQIELLKQRQVEAEVEFKRQTLAEVEAISSALKLINISTNEKDDTVSFNTSDNLLLTIRKDLDESTSINNIQEGVLTKLENNIVTSEANIKTQQKFVEQSEGELEALRKKAEASRKKIETQREKVSRNLQKVEDEFQKKMDEMVNSSITLDESIEKLTQKEDELKQLLLSKDITETVYEHYNMELQQIQAKNKELKVLQEEQNNTLDDIQQKIFENREVMDKLNVELSVKRSKSSLKMTAKNKKIFKARVNAIFRKVLSLKEHTILLEDIQSKFNQLTTAKTELSRLSVELEDIKHNYSIKKKLRIQQSDPILSKIKEKNKFIEELQSVFKNIISTDKKTLIVLNRNKLDILRRFCEYMRQYNEIKQLNITGTDEALLNSISMNMGNIELPILDLSNLSILEATPLSATPLSATPLSATPLSATPLSATPLSATPLSATPLSATPLSATPLSATPLSATPLELQSDGATGYGNMSNSTMNMDMDNQDNILQTRGILEQFKEQIKSMNNITENDKEIMLELMSNGILSVLNKDKYNISGAYEIAKTIMDDYIRQ